LKAPNYLFAAIVVKDYIPPTHLHLTLELDNLVYVFKTVCFSFPLCFFLFFTLFFFYFFFLLHSFPFVFLSPIISMFLHCLSPLTSFSKEIPGHPGFWEGEYKGKGLSSFDHKRDSQ
jgi:hypothetical protein